eukprot:CAMPEP_0202088402 /NCGR_PEP_ID=MMETSP0964-20121228/38513_1 /ASSEMBLY_ACC=CAM_ASM_000500 /TAXON_ID=4773 /ORGANISM="Schizochytrium aggregatum, Strain ATCC28209" /LENGTH=35 /DNA_ID= /DNA_START= /DNA_END= /DNA_ORIENTATION=
MNGGVEGLVGEGELLAHLEHPVEERGAHEPCEVSL